MLSKELAIVIVASISQYLVLCFLARFKALEGEYGVSFANHVLVLEHKLHIQANALPSSGHREI